MDEKNITSFNYIAGTDGKKIDNKIFYDLLGKSFDAGMQETCGQTRGKLNRVLAKEEKTPQKEKVKQDTLEK